MQTAKKLSLYRGDLQLKTLQWQFFCNSWISAGMQRSFLFLWLEMLPVVFTYAFGGLPSTANKVPQKNFREIKRCKILPFSLSKRKHCARESINCQFVFSVFGLNHPTCYHTRGYFLKPQFVQRQDRKFLLLNLKYIKFANLRICFS